MLNCCQITPSALYTQNQGWLFVPLPKPLSHSLFKSHFQPPWCALLISAPPGCTSVYISSPASHAHTQRLATLACQAEVIFLSLLSSAWKTWLLLPTVGFVFYHIPPQSLLSFSDCSATSFLLCCSLYIFSHTLELLCSLLLHCI